MNFKNFNFVNNSVQKAKSIAVDYSMKFNEIKNHRANSIALLGQVGSGKTHLSIAIANSLMSRSIGVYYMPFRDVITSLKQNMIDEEYYQKKMQEIKNSKVLLIDDLFKGSTRNGKANESDMSIMFEIINHRYLNKSPIIVSSEYHPEQLVDFDEAVGSRILEMCKDYMIIMNNGDNYRLKDLR